MSLVMPVRQSRSEPMTGGTWGNLGGTCGTWGQTDGTFPSFETVTKCTAEMLSAAPATLHNQLPGFQYDLAGNMVVNGSATYTYDAENQIKTAGGVTYVYDGDGKRVNKSLGRLYWYGTGSDSLTETDGSGNLLREFVYFNGKRIARIDLPAGTVHYYFADHLGTLSEMASATGTIENDSDYYPYGGERVIKQNVANEHYKFSGKEWDSESGLDEFGARYDSSSTGRFMSPDPLMASAHVGNPQSWNRYAYALNNPLRFVDLNGMDPGCGTGNDSKCKVTIRVNVIYDKNANGGKGLTDQQKKDFQDKTLGKATKDLGKSGIGLQVTYTAGSLSTNDGKVTVSGLQSNSLNLLVSSSLPIGNGGESALKNGIYMSMVGTDDAHDHNVFPFFTNTVEHEFTHQLKGDTRHPNSDPISYYLDEFNVDFRVQMMGWGMRQDSLVSGAQNKPFTVQPKQENIKPRTDQ